MRIRKISNWSSSTTWWELTLIDNNVGKKQIVQKTTYIVNCWLLRDKFHKEFNWLAMWVVV